MRITVVMRHFCRFLGKSRKFDLAKLAKLAKVSRNTGAFSRVSCFAKILKRVSSKTLAALFKKIRVDKLRRYISFYINMYNTVLLIDTVNQIVSFLFSDYIDT